MAPQEAKAACLFSCIKLLRAAAPEGTAHRLLSRCLCFCPSGTLCFFQVPFLEEEMKTASHVFTSAFSQGSSISKSTCWGVWVQICPDWECLFLQLSCWCTWRGWHELQHLVGNAFLECASGKHTARGPPGFPVVLAPQEHDCWFLAEA